MEAPASGPLTVERLVVRRDRLVCDVRLAPGFSQVTNAWLVEAVRRDYPSILAHACVNEHGNTFAAVAERTSVPHLLEHMIIDAQARAEEGGGATIPQSAAPTAPFAQGGREGSTFPNASATVSGATSAGGANGAERGGSRKRRGASPPTIYVGTTEWTDRFTGRARIEVSFSDDFAALRAVRDAVATLNALLNASAYDHSPSHLR